MLPMAAIRLFSLSTCCKQTKEFSSFTASCPLFLGEMDAQCHPGAIDNVPKCFFLNYIDLSSPDIVLSAYLLKRACLETGYFYVINHGISEEFMEEVFARSRSFFGLPLSEKMKSLKNEKHRGYTPLFDDQRPDSANQSHGDFKEGYYIGIEKNNDDPEAQKPFYGQNVWPADDLLPGWRETMEKYHQKSLEVAKAVARIIALALDLEADFFDKPEMLGEPIATLRLLHYEGKISDPSKGIYRAGAHSDYGLITLLASDYVLGLQVCKEKEEKPQIWEYVSPLKGSFLVTLGDMLERWSNSIFRSTLYRVVGNGQEGYSIAFFLEPSHDCLVDCLPTCKSEENPPRFPPILCCKYLTDRYRDTHVDYRTYKKDPN